MIKHFKTAKQSCVGHFWMWSFCTWSGCMPWYCDRVFPGTPRRQVDWWGSPALGEPEQERAPLWVFQNQRVLRGMLWLLLLRIVHTSIFSIIRDTQMGAEKELEIQEIVYLTKTMLTVFQYFVWFWNSQFQMRSFACVIDHSYYHHVIAG